MIILAHGDTDINTIIDIAKTDLAKDNKFFFEIMIRNVVYSNEDEVTKVEEFIRSSFKIKQITSNKLEDNSTWYIKLTTQYIEIEQLEEILTLFASKYKSDYRVLQFWVEAYTENELNIKDASEIIKFMRRIDEGSYTLRVDSNTDLIIQDFIYINSGNELEIKLITRDTGIPLIRLTSVSINSERIFKIFIDIVGKSGEFKLTRVIKSKGDLISALLDAIDAMNEMPEFYRYAYDLMTII